MANKHLSYKEFKQTFGDLGVTHWVRYNWLNVQYQPLDPTPKELQKVNYLQKTTGQQYIDTNWKPDNLDNFELEIMFTNYDVGYKWGCTKNNSTNQRLLATGNQIYFFNGSSYSQFEDTNALNSIRVNGSNVYSNDTLKFTNFARGTDYLTFTLFAQNFGGTIRYANSGTMLKYAIIKENGIAVRNLIPVYTKQQCQLIDGNSNTLTTYAQGTAGMWDYVEEKFYVNQGTGTFIVGEDI